ncbi:MAG: hypothetical protein ACF8PG_10285, partial [Maioricimonas sp. JB045]
MLPHNRIAVIGRHQFPLTPRPLVADWTFGQQMMTTESLPTPDTSSTTSSSCRPRRILVLSGPFPTATQPGYGVFVKERMRAVADLPGYEVQVVSPVPYFPRIPAFKRWSQWAEFPRNELIDGLQVTRPRFFHPPKIGGYFHPRLAWGPLRRAVDRIR